MSSWVLLRGLMREQRHWGDFPALLAAALRDADMLTPDFPGNGIRHAEDSCTSVADMVEACRADLRERGQTGPYHLLALSLGAMVAVEWSTRYPGEVAACVLINTSMRPYSPFYQRLRWQNYAAIAGMALRGGAQRQERLILRLTSNRHAGDAALLRRWIAYQNERPVSRANALRQLRAAARFRAPSMRPPVPMLVLCGDADRLVDARCSVRLAEAWQLPCLHHPDAGHDVPLDDPAWVAAAVARWIGSVATASTGPGAVSPTAV